MMQTADEFYNEDLNPLQNMIAFTKLHVTEAKEEAINYVLTKLI